MKSGFDDYSDYWGNPFYDDAYNEIKDHGPFIRKVFRPISALRALDGPQGHTVHKPYEGGDYDPSKYELIPNAWTHEHCKVCSYQIQEDHSYWANEADEFLCDACYEHYVLEGKPNP
jgi:hypothetical protein